MRFVLNSVFDVFCLRDRVDLVSIRRELSIQGEQISLLFKTINDEDHLSCSIFKAIALAMGLSLDLTDELWELLVSETVLVPYRRGATTASSRGTCVRGNLTRLYRHFPSKFDAANVKTLGFRFGNLYLISKVANALTEYDLAKQLVERAFSGVWLDRARPLFWNTGELVCAGGGFVDSQTFVWLTRVLQDLREKEESYIYEIDLREFTSNRIDLNEFTGSCSGILSPLVQQSVIADESIRDPFTPSFTMVMSRYRQTGEWDSGRSCTACGAHADRSAAHAISAAEAVERYAAGTYNIGELKYGRQEGCIKRIDPAVLYDLTESQSETAGLQPFNRACCYYWRNGVNVMTGQNIQLVADLCYYPFEPLSYPQRCRWANSSGMAAGRTDEEAQFSAFLELIERDAFMRAWISRKAPPKLADRALLVDLCEETEKMEAIGFEVNVLDITCNRIPVAMVVMCRKGWPALVCGAAARNTLREAILGAWKEAEVGVFCRLVDPVMMSDKKPEIDIKDVKNPDDHACFFNHPQNQEMVSFLWSSSFQSDRDPDEPCFTGKVLQEFDVVSACRQLGIDDLYLIPYGSLCGLKVVRLLSPHLVPLVFGFDQLPRTYMAGASSV